MVPGQHVVYRALSLNQQILGCDRELLLSLMLLCVTLCVSSLSPLVCVLSGLLFAVGFYLLRVMGEHDLRLRHVYLRYRNYRRYYRAQAGVQDPGLKRY